MLIMNLQRINGEMMNFKDLVGIVLISAIISACGGLSGGDDEVASNTYSTTSTRGDYSEWTLSGSQLNATWQVINDTGTVDYTYTIAATCTAAAANGSRNCTIDTGSCADGVAVCSSSPSGSFIMMDVPGVALFVNTDSGTVDKQLHVGFVKSADACADDVSGNYTFIHTGLGKRDSFGMYRSDANFINVLHSDFGYETADLNATQSLVYNTGTESEMFMVVAAMA